MLPGAFSTDLPCSFRGLQSSNVSSSRLRSGNWGVGQCNVDVVAK